jgi:hypothetical protein
MRAAEGLAATVFFLQLQWQSGETVAFACVCLCAVLIG